MLGVKLLITRILEGSGIERGSKSALIYWHLYATFSAVSSVLRAGGKTKTWAAAALDKEGWELYHSIGNSGHPERRMTIAVGSSSRSRLLGEGELVAPPKALTHLAMRAVVRLGSSRDSGPAVNPPCFPSGLAEPNPAPPPDQLPLPIIGPLPRDPEFPRRNRLRLSKSQRVTCTHTEMFKIPISHVTI